VMARRLAAALLAAGSVLMAQVNLPPAPSKLALPLRVGVFGQTPLTLEEAVAATVENNRGIQVARFDVRIATLNVAVARGAFEPVLNADAQFRYAVIPTASVILGGDDGRLVEREWFGNPSVTGLVPRLGGSYTLDFTSSRLTTNNQFVVLNPQFPTRLTFSFTQPLLRGLRFDEPRQRVEIARQNRLLTEEQFRQAVIDAVTAAVQAYHELLFARRNLEIQLTAVDLARRQVESNRRMVGEGLLAPIDLVEAETQLAASEQNAWAAQQAVTTAENALKQLMLPDRNSPLWATELVPVSPPRTDAPLDPLPEAVADALAGRPEVAQAGIAAEINLLETRLAREAVRPQVNLVGSLSAAGLAGNLVERDPSLGFGTAAQVARINELSALLGLPPLPPQPDRFAVQVPEVFIGGYPQSLRNLSTWNYPTAIAGLRISLPLFNRAAGAALAAAEVQGRRIAAQRELTEQRIEAEVRNAQQAVVAGRGALAAAALAARLAGEQYESELRRFQAGLSTVFLVLQRQNDMIAARGRALRAEIDLALAVAELEEATGRTLAAHGVVVERVR
jgi:outer membrane protein TolC